MSFAKVAIVVSDKRPRWVSCRSISANLRQVYSDLFGERAECFELDRRDLGPKTRRLARALESFAPDAIVFLDHQPHPARLIETMHRVASPLFRPRLVFHCYGDFTLFSPNWARIERHLRQHEVAFIAASERQKALLSRFIVDAACIWTVPFPLDAGYFASSAERRRRARERFGIAVGGRAIVYTGRLSLQKNVARLVEALGRGPLKDRCDDQLFLAGPFDSLGEPLFRSERRKIDYRPQFEAALAALPAGVARRVRHLGNLRAASLVDLYNAADAYVSLSLHHDEDFGMAPAEALLCGAPVLLTDWGGYADFVREKGDGALVPVGLSDDGLRCDLERMRSELARLLDRSSAETQSDRERRRQRARSRFSVESVRREIGARFSAESCREFLGFTPQMRRLLFASRLGPVYPDGPRPGGHYEKVYSAYLAGPA